MQQRYPYRAEPLSPMVTVGGPIDDLRASAEQTMQDFERRALRAVLVFSLVSGVAFALAFYGVRTLLAPAEK